MGFFSRGNREHDQASEARSRIEGGGIPAAAERRLQELAGGSLFTSGLSVREFALLDRMGPRPLAQVMGASVVRTGWQYLPPLDPVPVDVNWYGGSNAARYRPMTSSLALRNRMAEPSWAQVRRYQWNATVVCELDVLSDAWMTARRRALDRLTEEALQVGADAVVGVHLHHSEHDFGKRTIEYVVTGTAVRMPQSTAASWPILTDLSLQDYWRLNSAGFDPVGLLATTVVVFASPSRSTRLQRLRTMSRNQELEELSRGFTDARVTVRGRLEGQVGNAHGEGAVGVELSHEVRREKFALASALTSAHLRGWQRGRLGIPYYGSGRGDIDRAGWVITMHAAGTGVRRRADAPSPPQLKSTIRMGGRR